MCVSYISFHVDFTCWNQNVLKFTSHVAYAGRMDSDISDYFWYQHRWMDSAEARYVHRGCRCHLSGILVCMLQRTYPWRTCAWYDPVCNAWAAEDAWPARWPSRHTISCPSRARGPLWRMYTQMYNINHVITINQCMFVCIYICFVLYVFVCNCRWGCQMFVYYHSRKNVVAGYCLLRLKSPSKVSNKHQ